MIENFSDLISSIENVSVEETRVFDSDFALSIRIQESDIGWIALESLARLCASSTLVMEVCASQQPSSLSFEMHGAVSEIPDLMPDLHELVFPPDSPSEHLVG